MSFDIFYQTARFSGPPASQTNPLTGAVQQVLPQVPLDPDEVRAVRGVLDQAGAAGPDEHGCYVVDLRDGGGAEVYADRLEHGCMAAVRGLTPELARFLFDLLRAGNWVMLPAMAEPVAITAGRWKGGDLPEGFPRLVACDSVDALRVLLASGVRAWEEYRDQVTGCD